MGIPSYYRKLIRSHKGLVRKSHPGTVDWLWMDFNCLIYHCLRRPDLRPYPGSAGRLEWEREFIQAIQTYTKKVVGEVRPTKGVYIAIDGVVPMAKMRQQRLRRFKSAWLTEHGLAEGQMAGIERWDTNAITPGTEFMRSLRLALEKEVGRHKGWRLSSSDEPGEGEHKVMAEIRSVTGGSHAVYGLDADLIVLSLLTQDTKKEGMSIHLFREEVENGSLVRNAAGEEEFQWFSIDALRDILLAQEGASIRDYCCAMSFLGNDFLPSSLGMKMREDGHADLLDMLSVLHRKGLRLVDDGDGISAMGLQELLRILVGTEERAIEAALSRKARDGRPYAAVELPLGDPNWALAQQEERCLMDGKGLIGNWREIYAAKFLQGAEEADRIYCEGLHWIWDYYRGLPVCYNWYYPWNVPPLWPAVALAAMAAKAPTPVIRATDILPVEQLCLVLPPASWHLIPSAKHRGLMKNAPWLFPKEFHFCSLGKRWFWECEAKIPVPSIQEVKLLV